MDDASHSICESNGFICIVDEEKVKMKMKETEKLEKLKQGQRRRLRAPRGSVRASGNGTYPNERKKLADRSMTIKNLSNYTKLFSSAYVLESQEAKRVCNPIGGSH